MKNDKDLQKLFDFYEKHMPETAILVKNADRYEKAKQAVQDIADFVWESDPSATIDIQPDQIVGTSACMTVVATEIIFGDLKKFCTAISEGKNFEIYPSTDGKLSFNVVFDNLYSPASPHKK